MNDLLNIVLDFSLDTLTKIDVLPLLSDLSMFLNCYQLQS
jgi:hypothetical protein